ncbi:MAG: hypothetical protein SFT92_08120 [Rickettsiales bacterium]|nr:hypothetical protein [Rickettsiales bacterium]
MKTTALLVIISLSYAAAAEARMRDMSMSEQESLRQPSATINGSTPNYLGGKMPEGYTDGLPGAVGVATNLPVSVAGRFMDSYCSTDYAPVAVTAAAKTCLLQQRKAACDLYTRLPKDAKQVLSYKIDCVYSEMDAGNSQTDACLDADRSRITMLKKYWKDQNTAYALVFLPDIALNASANCVTHNGGY